MTTARQKVLSYFDKSRAASVREISRALKMSPATVRHHLRVLTSDGRLELVSVRGLDRRGRPEKIYSLPRAMLGDNLSVLSDALLTEAGPGLQMEALAERITRHLPGETNLTGQPLTKRLSLIIEKVNQMNYHARWEAGPEGPRIIFGHCPYAGIIKNHPELCQMDEAILKEWMGKPITQIFKAGKDGSTICVFTMGR